MDEESNDQDQELHVHVHHKEEKEEPELPKTFEPQPIEPEFTPAPTKKRRIKKWMFIVVAVILVIAIAAGAVAYYLVNKKTTTTNKTSNSSSNSKTTINTAVSSLQPTVVVKTVRDYVKTKYPQVMPEGSKLTAEQIYFKDSNEAPFWMLAGEKYYINYSGDGAVGLNIYYNWTSGGDDIVLARAKSFSNFIIDSLTSQGFKKSTSSVYGNSKYGNESNLAYTKDDVICVTGSPGAILSPPVSFSCGQISKYTKNLPSYKEIAPYITAYSKTEKMLDGDIFIFQELKDGMNGYQNATVSLGNAGVMVGGAMGLFYKTPSGDWTFFGGIKQILPCTSYNTKDLQYAFAYENCFDSSKTPNTDTGNVASYYKLQP